MLDDDRSFHDDAFIKRSLEKYLLFHHICLYVTFATPMFYRAYSGAESPGGAVHHPQSALPAIHLILAQLQFDLPEAPFEPRGSASFAPDSEFRRDNLQPFLTTMSENVLL